VTGENRITFEVSSSAITAVRAVVAVLAAS
jgi:hypothetical protein